MHRLITDLPPARTARGAVALTVGLMTSLLLGGPGAALPVVGGLCTINADCDEPAPRRLPRLLATMAGGAGGVMVGALVHRPGPWQVLALTLAGLAAGLIGTHGPSGLLCGLKLQILTTIGISLRGTVPLWQAAGLYLLGTLPMLALVMVELVWASDESAPARTWRPDPLRALRLGLCMGSASLVAVLIHPEHSWWLPVTVCLVFRVNEDRIGYRVAHRFAGTILGLLLTWALLEFVSYGWTLVVVAAVIGALLPGWTDQAYLLHTMLVTVIVLALAGPGGGGLLGARLLDTAIACVIVVIFWYLLWPPGGRARRRRTLLEPLAEPVVLPAAAEKG
ncbi:FUSC family protein [Nocardia crassostreae]|uniref:FUSC family protein n=1 Tax=Nocardia crassostreae TaxID=53428 RepID=UPI00082B4487|nr:FUSC family protein [Nocardia crassostreae]